MSKWDPVRPDGSGAHRCSWRNRPRPSAPGRFHLWCLALAAAALLGADDAPRPKYGPTAVRLYRARDFLRQHPAPDFWALIPYYIPQANDSSCSAASAAMVLNALRADRNLTAADELVTSAGLLHRVPAADWKSRVAPGGPGLTLDELARNLVPVLEACEIANARVEVFRLKPDDQSATDLRRLLADNERSDRDLLLANFLQSTLTGDPDAEVGHFAPIAAYDAGRDRVLILDPDRRWYEPYWVTVDALLAAMTTTDSDSGKPRGLIRISR